MVYFNARRPTTLGALQEYYTGSGMTPERADYALSGRQREYLHQQGEALGVGDPAVFFEKQQRAAELAATPSGGELEALRQLGQLPGQQAEAKRQALWDTVSAAKAKESQELASLQTGRAMARFPMVPGQPTVLSPTESAEASRLGVTPEQYAMQQRLGTARTVNVSGIDRSVIAQPNVNPGELVRHPQFQAVARANPGKARQLFSAVTGGDLDNYLKVEAASEATRLKEGTEFFRKGFQEGLFQRDDTGKITMRKRVTDPATGRLVLGSDYGELGDYEKGLWGDTRIQKAVLGDEAMELSDLRARKKAAIDEHTRKLASLQMGEGQGVPMVFQSDAFRRLMKEKPGKATAMIAQWKQNYTSPIMGQAEYLTEPFRAPETAGFSWLQ